MQVQSFSDVFQADPVLRFCFSVRPVTVPDAESEFIIRDLNIDKDLQYVLFSASVFKRVLHERNEKHGGHFDLITEVGSMKSYLV